MASNETARRAVLRAGGLAALGSVAGCTGGGGSDATQVGMVYATGGLGDGGFNDNAQRGLERAKEEFDVKSSNVQPDAVSDFGPAQQRFAQSSDPDYDLVTCIGFLQKEALTKTASDYPDQDFMIVDEVVDTDNVLSFTYREEEVAYLAGVMAGGVTTSEMSAGAGETDPSNTVVGFVGGIESDLIDKFEAGYTAGVRRVSSDIEIQTSYVGSFADPSGGKEAALAMYNADADVVFHAAGNTGTGVFQAAQEQGRYAIGVDRAQSVTRSSYANVILGSMIKRVDTAVYEGIEAVVNDSFQGAHRQLGLKENGLDVHYGEQLGSEIPQSVTDEIETARGEVEGGEVSIPTDPDSM